MKKNFKKSVLALALVAAVVGVVAPDVAKAVNGAKQTVSWQKIDRDGEEEGTPVPGDESNPFPADCTGIDQDVCAEGTLPGQTAPTLFYYYN